jgi:rSAM/selenodomain-associated transferase 2
MNKICTIIIPTLNAASRLRQLLVTLQDHLPQGFADIIVVDGDSRDGSADVALRYGARSLISPRGRGLQLAAGAHQARTPWLVFLHADSTPGEGFVQSLQKTVTNNEARHTAWYWRLQFDQPHWKARVLAKAVDLRCKLWGLPYGDQGLIIHQTLYEAVGGYPPVSLMEDVLLARALGKNRLKGLAGTIITSAERYEQEGYLKRCMKNQLLLWRLKRGTLPDRLRADYDA